MKKIIELQPSEYDGIIKKEEKETSVIVKILGAIMLVLLVAIACPIVIIDSIFTPKT